MGIYSIGIPKSYRNTNPKCCCSCKHVSKRGNDGPGGLGGYSSSEYFICEHPTNPLIDGIHTESFQRQVSGYFGICDLYKKRKE